MDADRLDRVAVRRALLTMQATLLAALRALDDDGYVEDDEGLAFDIASSWLVDLTDAVAQVQAAPDVRAAVARHKAQITD